MKALQDFLSDNCIPTVEFKLVSLIPFLLTLYVAVALLTFLKFVNESF